MDSINPTSSDPIDPTRLDALTLDDDGMSITSDLDSDNEDSPLEDSDSEWEYFMKDFPSEAKWHEDLEKYDLSLRKEAEKVFEERLREKLEKEFQEKCELLRKQAEEEWEVKRKLIEKRYKKKYEKRYKKKYAQVEVGGQV